MNSPKTYLLDRMIKNWVVSVPSPAAGRYRLLHTAASLKQAGITETPWFDAPTLRHPTNQYYAVFSWAVSNGFQSRVVVCI